MRDDDFAAAILVEICQKHVARAEADRDYDLGLEGPVTIAYEHGDSVVKLR
jgi:hypothetical protein